MSKVEAVTYRLELPQELANVHILMCTLEQLEVQEDLTYVEQPIRLLD